MVPKIHLSVVSHGQGHLVHQLFDDLKSTIVTGSFHVTLTRAAPTRKEWPLISDQFFEIGFVCTDGCRCISTINSDNCLL